MTNHLIQVDFYKSTGKWGYGGAVIIEGSHQHDFCRADLARKIVKYQDIIHKESIGQYYVVTSSDGESCFANYLFKPGEILGYGD